MNIVYRRGFYEQMIDILDAARQPILKTHLVRKANIEWRRMKFKLSFLCKKGLLAQLPDGKYRTTRKGFYALQVWQDLKDLMR